LFTDVAIPARMYGRLIDEKSGLRRIRLRLNSVRMTNPWINSSMPSRKAVRSMVIWK